MQNVQPIIMVIEDEKLLLEAITKKLELSGAQVQAYTNAEDAVSVFAKGSPIPDAIWLDYHLEGINGMEFVERVKSNNEYKKIPIMVVSNSADEDKIKGMLSLGVDRYMLKAKHRLEDLVNEIIEMANKNVKNINS